MRILFCGAVCSFAALFLMACSGNSGVSAPTASNQTRASANQTANASTQNSHTPSTAINTNAPKASTPTAAAGGEPVDTSEYDAEIKRLEAKAKKSPADQATRLALAKVYTDRGDALTGVRQYRAALGDYRRAMRFDPNNKQAQKMAGTIIGILQSMGRDVPPEGQEPPPLPLKS